MTGKISYRFSFILTFLLSALMTGPCRGACGVQSTPRQGCSGNLPPFLPTPPPTGSSVICERQLFYFSQSITWHLGSWLMVAFMSRSCAQTCWCAVWVVFCCCCCCCCCCWVLDVQLIVSRGEIWGNFSLCHVFSKFFFRHCSYKTSAWNDIPKNSLTLIPVLGQLLVTSWEEMNFLASGQGL